MRKEKGYCEIPKSLVEKRFMSFDYGVMQYVMDCLEENYTKIKNIHGYMLATLYNAPVTIDTYYYAEANHDLHGGC